MYMKLITNTLITLLFVICLLGCEKDLEISAPVTQKSGPDRIDQTPVRLNTKASHIDQTPVRLNTK